MEYITVLFLQGTATCSACPAGKECTSDPNSPTDCNSGEYSLSGESTCTVCPSGSMCPFKTSSPIACSSGQTTGGNTGQTSCTDCTAGNACPDPRYAYYFTKLKLQVFVWKLIECLSLPGEITSLSLLCEANIRCPGISNLLRHSPWRFISVP